MYQERINSALAIITEHNEAIGKTDGKPNPGFVNPDQFFASIKQSGGTTEERLKSMSYEDIMQFLPPVVTAAGNVAPKPLAKAIAQAFRGNDTGEQISGEDKRYVGAKKAERMSPRELVEAFDPEEPTSPVGKRLSEMSQGRAFIVYESGRKIDTETTTKLLLEIKGGFPELAQVKVKNGVRKVYKIGELPNNFADENPLYPGRPLRPDGTCDQTGRSWEGIALEVRQLIRLAMNTGELKIDGIDKAHQTMDWIMGLNADATNTVKFRYQKAAVIFDEKPDDRPKLRIVLGSSKGKGGEARPFDGGRRVEWTDAGGYYSAK